MALFKNDNRPHEIVHSDCRYITTLGMLVLTRLFSPLCPANMNNVYSLVVVFYQSQSAKYDLIAKKFKKQNLS